MLSEFIAFSCLLTALTHSHICFAFVPTVTRSRSSGTAFALWNTTTRFSRRVLPLSAVFKESFAPLCSFQGEFCPSLRFSRRVLPLSAAPQPGAAPTPVPRAVVPILWARIRAPHGDAFAGGMSWGWCCRVPAGGLGWGARGAPRPHSGAGDGSSAVGCAVPVALGNAVAMGTRQV